MRQTVVGIFDYGVDAQMAAQDLMNSGIPSSSIDIAVRGAKDRNQSTQQSFSNTNTTQDNSINNANGEFNRPNPTHSTHHDTRSKDESFFSSLFDSKDESKRYAEAARNGAIVTVHTDSKEQAEKAAKVLDKCGAIDVNERTTRSGNMSSNQRGWINTNRVPNNSMPVVEENLNIGKRNVETGGVTMRSRIIEKPVEEHLRLREEHLNVERNKVDRPATEKDMTAFKEGSTRIVEHAEVPVVNKEARVVEEVRLNKETTAHDETVRDTVRKQDVEINKLDPDRDSENLNRTDRDNLNRRGL